jgi:hypothetical protein
MGSEPFPIKSYEEFPQKVIDGFTIVKNNNRWVAVLVIETSYGRMVKLYAWVKRKGEWKVDLANLNISHWDMDVVSSKTKEFIKKYTSKDTVRYSNQPEQAGTTSTPEEELSKELFGRD